MGKSFDTVVFFIGVKEFPLSGLSDFNPKRVESPGSKQLQTLSDHLDYEFVRKVLSSKNWVVVYSEDVHGGLEQVS